MMPFLSSLAAPEAATLATSGAVSDDKVAIIRNIVFFQAGVPGLSEFVNVLIKTDKVNDSFLELIRTFLQTSLFILEAVTGIKNTSIMPCKSALMKSICQDPPFLVDKNNPVPDTMSSCKYFTWLVICEK